MEQLVGGRLGLPVAKLSPIDCSPGSRNAHSGRQYPGYRARKKADNDAAIGSGPGGDTGRLPHADVVRVRSLSISRFCSSN